MSTRSRSKTSGVADAATTIRFEAAVPQFTVPARVYEQIELVVRDCNGLVLAFGEDTSRRA